MDTSTTARVWAALAIVMVLVTGVAFAAGGTARAQDLPVGGTFTDDDGNVHEGFIEAIAADGITQGCDLDGTLYCPSLLVNRGQMASFLARALDLPAASQDYFIDDATSTHQENINRIAEAGITVGVGDGTYAPEGFVRRDQMAAFLTRALQLPAASRDYFSDDAGNVHEDAINATAEDGITLGCDATGTVYCPDSAVRRDQMASFLGRGLDLTENFPPTTTTTTTTIATTTTVDLPQTRTVTVGDDFFSPSSVNIDTGDSIFFSKMTSGFHDITFVSSAIGGNPQGATASTYTWTVTFTTTGTYVYFCTIHAGMDGTITVSS